MTTEILTHYLRHASSFAVTWLTAWFVLYLLLWLVYPGVRRYLATLHPATASSLLLGLLALPFLTSLVATALVFTPLLQQNLITTHYHSADCEGRFPLLKSGIAIGGVMLLLACALLAMLGKFFSHLLFSLKLEAKLLQLGEKGKDWYVLPHRERLVFTMGWLKNTVFITEGLLKHCSNEDISIIVEHEKEHVRRKDNLRLLLGRVLVAVVPRFLATKFTDDLHLFTEVACDFSSAKKHGAVNVAETLLRIQRLTPQTFNHFQRALVSAFTGSEVEARILLLLEAKPSAKPGKFRPLIYLVILAVLSLLLVDPLHHSFEWLMRGHWN